VLKRGPRTTEKPLAALALVLAEAIPATLGSGRLPLTGAEGALAVGAGLDATEGAPFPDQQPLALVASALVASALVASALVARALVAVRLWPAGAAAASDAVGSTLEETLASKAAFGVAAELVELTPAVGRAFLAGVEPEADVNWRFWHAPATP